MAIPNFVGTEPAVVKDLLNDLVDATNDEFAASFIAPTRRFTTVALLLAASGTNAGDGAVANNAPGMIFTWNGSAWVPSGVGQFADASARSAAITSPVAAMRSRIATEAFDRIYLDSAWRPITPLAPLRPTVTATGGSASISGSGVIQFSGVSALHLDSLFTAEFPIVEAMSRITQSAVEVLKVRVRSSSTDISTSTYDFDGSYVAASASGAPTPTGYAVEDGSSWNANAAWGTRRFDEWSFFDFAEASAWSHMRIGSTIQGSSGNTPLDGSMSFAEKSNAARTGISIYPNAGTMSGTIQFLGWAV